MQINSMDSAYLARCFDLARLGAGSVNPNPMVGAVLVYENRIIGEGFHQIYGGAHAEVNAVNSVTELDRKYIPDSTLYVSLEPCCIFGNTPPCTQLILDQGIKKVIISVLDQTAEVSGNGIRQLEAAGVEVKVGLCQKRGADLAQIRNTFVTQKRPYVILKYAQSEDGYLAPEHPQQYWLSNKFSKRLVHKWRSEFAAILVGNTTAFVDNPKLTNRLYYGSSPIRISIDRLGKLPPDLNLFDGSQKTLIFTQTQRVSPDNKLEFIKIDFKAPIFEQILSALADRKISSLLVEGGAKTLQSFIEQGFWDEARILIAPKMLGKGIAAPRLPGPVKHRYQIDQDQLIICKAS